jgi:hypothetical protein
VKNKHIAKGTEYLFIRLVGKTKEYRENMQLKACCRFVATTFSLIDLDIYR